MIIRSFEKGQGYLKTLSVLLNPKDNGGESVTLSVDLYDNGDGIPDGIVSNTHLETQSYGTSSSKISLYGCSFEQLAEGVKELSEAIEQFKKERK